MVCFISLTAPIYTRTNSERQLLWENIQQNVANVQFTAPTHRNTTMMILSMQEQHDATGEVVTKINLRKAKKDPWVFKGSLDDVGEAVVPHVLHNVTLWMPKEVHTVKTEARMHALHRSCSIIHISTNHADSHI